MGEGKEVKEDDDGRFRSLLCEKEQRDERRYSGHLKESGGRCLLLLLLRSVTWLEGRREAGETPASLEDVNVRSFTFPLPVDPPLNYPHPSPLLYLLHLLASFSRSAHTLDSVLQLPEVELATAKFAFHQRAKEGITSGCRFLIYRAPLRPAGTAPKPVGA